MSIKQEILKLLKYWWDKAFYHRTNKFSVEEVRKRLEEYNYYNNASYSGVWKVLQQLVNEEIIIREKNNGKVNYCLQYKKLLAVIK